MTSAHKKRHAEEKVKAEEVEGKKREQEKTNARDQIIEKVREPRQKGAGGNGRNANS